MISPCQNEAVPGQQSRIASLTFRVLGPLIMMAGGRDITPTAHKQRQVVALLLLNGGKRVSASALTSELWNSDPPRTAKTALQTYISALRRLLADATGRSMREVTDTVLTTDNGAYTLHVSPEDWDGLRFEDLLMRAQESALRGDFQQVEQRLEAALALCYGDFLGNVTHGPQLHPIIRNLTELQVYGEELLIDALLRSGKRNEAVRRAATLAARNPLHEGLQTQLMRALYAADRRADALEVYRKLYLRLQDELGVAPAPSTRTLHQMLLQDSPDDTLFEDLSPLRFPGPAARRR